MFNSAATNSVSSPGLTGRSSSRRRMSFVISKIIRLRRGYWMPAFAGMTAEAFAAKGEIS